MKSEVSAITTEDLIKQARANSNMEVCVLCNRTRFQRDLMTLSLDETARNIIDRLLRATNQTLTIEHVTICRDATDCDKRVKEIHDAAKTGP